MPPRPCRSHLVRFTGLLLLASLFGARQPTHLVVAWAVLAPSSSRRQASSRPSEQERIAAQALSLQDPHPRESPANVLRRLAEVCDEEGIDVWDVYGDYPSTAVPSITKATTQQDPETEVSEETTLPTEALENLDGEEKDASSSDVDMEEAFIEPRKESIEEKASRSNQLEPSFLRRFEKEIAAEVGKEDAVFMPSGVMAQSIALLVHQSGKLRSADGAGQYFVCHETSHLLLHEQEGYAELLHMKPISVSTRNEANEEGLERPAMGLNHVLEKLTDLNWSESVLSNNVAALLVELPHRELGGKITSWTDLVRLSEWCKTRKIPLHCDGARLFESLVAYDNRSPAELASLFDSVYLSFYKGLGGISGAMLCGSSEFCAQARIWQRRFGGNLYTLLPYAVSSYDGYTQNWKKLSQQSSQLQEQKVKDDRGTQDDMDVSRATALSMSFAEKRDKLRQIVAKLSGEESLIPRLVTFDPAVPVTNMVHGYLRCTAEEGMEWCRWITGATGVQVLRRIRPLTDEESPEYKAGYRSMFEWSMGNANGQIPEDVFFEGWKALAETYVANHVAIENGESPIGFSEEDEEVSDVEVASEMPESDFEQVPIEESSSINSYD